MQTKCKYSGLEFSKDKLVVEVVPEEGLHSSTQHALLTTLESTNKPFDLMNI